MKKLLKRMKKAKAKMDSPVIPKGPKSERTLYLGNLRFDKSEDGIKTMLSRYGEVKWVKIIIDSQTKKKKGIAFAEMISSQAVQKAIKGLDGQLVEGRVIKASVALDRNASGSGDAEAVQGEKFLSSKREKKEPKELKKQKVKKKTGLQSLLKFLDK